MKSAWLRSFEMELRAPAAATLSYRSTMEKLSYPMRPKSAKYLRRSKALREKAGFSQSMGDKSRVRGRPSTAKASTSSRKGRGSSKGGRGAGGGGGGGGGGDSSHEAWLAWIREKDEIAKVQTSEQRRVEDEERSMRNYKVKEARNACGFW